MTKEFITQNIYYMELNVPRIEKCLAQLSEEQIWASPNEASNSVGNLILHLCGNIRQYIISGLGGELDIRQRSGEFMAKSGYTKSELVQNLTATIAESGKILVQMTTEKLLRKYNIQGFDLSGVAVVVHVTEHLSYHTGQIAFWTKHINNKDLAFYGEMDLEVKNKET